MQRAVWTTLAIVVLASSALGAGTSGGTPGSGTRVEGAIVSIDADVQQFVVGTTTVQVTDQTVIKKNGRPIPFANLAVGTYVAACGTVQEGILVANQVTVRSCAMPTDATTAAAPATAAPVAGKQGGPTQTLPKPLSPAEQADLVFMREEEKLARDVYLTLFAQWQFAAFKNIAASEQMHMDSIATLLTRYGVADPVAGMGVGEFASEHFQTLFNDLVATGSASLVAALSVGAAIEEIDIVDLFAKLPVTTHKDIARVYQNLESASEAHLRAFVGQLAALDVTYAPQYLDPALYDAIIGG